MRKQLTIIFLIFFFVLSRNSFAITPTFNLIQEIDFGNVILATGSCRMIPSTGVVIAFTGTFLCDLPSNRQVGKYTIVANPNKIVQVKVLPNLDNGNGYSFNPRVNLVSDVAQKVIFNNTDFVELNSGDSGVINIDIGGDLVIYDDLPANTTFNFVFDPAIEWNELE